VSLIFLTGCPGVTAIGSKLSGCRHVQHIFPNQGRAPYDSDIYFFSRTTAAGKHKFLGEGRPVAERPWIFGARYLGLSLLVAS
jgi:hypothetical protein